MICDGTHLREAVKRKAEQAQRKVRARLTEERTRGRAAERERGRARAAARIAELASEGGLGLEAEMREVGGVGRLKEKWRWSYMPAGAREQLVIFDHGAKDGPADQEIRAAILESEYGRGLYYASNVSRGREIGYYMTGRRYQNRSIVNWMNIRGSSTRWR